MSEIRDMLQPTAQSVDRSFSTDDLLRYGRHLSIDQVGLAGQRRLGEGRVLLIGAGGLGSPAALYLAAAGVGTIGLVDDDEVELSNLQRQLLHGTKDVGRPKVESAVDRIHDVNPGVAVETFRTRLTSSNALDILDGWDVVVDGTDNFPTRYLTNDACVLLGIPNVFGSVLRFEGQASVFSTPEGPCYRCLFREPPPAGLIPTCAEAGVLGVLPGLVGMIQATEAIKLLLGASDTLAGRLLLFDAWRMRFREVALRRDPECPACGTRELKELIDYEEFCGVSESKSSGVDAAGGGGELEPSELRERLQRGELTYLLDVREPWEAEVAPFAGAQLVPLGTLPGALNSIPRDRTVVAICHHGVRSARAVALLREAGVSRALNLVGGIDRWSLEVDPSVPRY